MPIFIIGLGLAIAFLNLIQSLVSKKNKRLIIRFQRPNMIQKAWIIAIAFLILVPLCDIIWFHTIFPTLYDAPRKVSIKDVAAAMEPDTIKFHRDGMYIFYFYERNQRVYIKELNGEWSVLGWGPIEPRKMTAEEMDWMITMGRVYTETVKQKPLWDNRLKAFDPLTGREIKIR